jgi:cysteinyl-tRNA synthetase
LIDLEKEEVIIRGIGRVTLRRDGAERSFEKGERFPVDVLREGSVGEGWRREAPAAIDVQVSAEQEKGTFWGEIHRIEAAFEQGLETGDSGETTNALLELDRTIWEAQQALESGEFISQARDILREMIVTLGVKLSSATDPTGCPEPLVEELLALRERFRQRKQWQDADAIRDSLQRVSIVIEDAEEGPRWHLKR